MASRMKNCIHVPLWNNRYSVSIPSIHSPINYSGIDDEDEFEDSIEVIVNIGDKFLHFHKYELLALFLQSGYEVIEFRENNERIYAKLKGYGDKFFIFTSPDIMLLKIKIENTNTDDSFRIPIDVYSSYVFYTDKKGIKLWRCKEVNELSKPKLEDFIKRLFYIPSYIL